MIRHLGYCTLPLLVLSSCGFNVPPPPPTAEPVRTEAREVTLEEHDTSGRLLWSVRSHAVSEQSARYDCDSIALTVNDPSADTFIESDWRAKLGTSLEASAAKGRIERETEATVVYLNEGFTMRLGTGWEARGATMKWDGARVVADGTVHLEKAGVSIRADRAVITPSLNRIALERVKGVVEGVAL